MSPIPPFLSSLSNRNNNNPAVIGAKLSKPSVYSHTDPHASVVAAQDARLHIFFTDVRLFDDLIYLMEGLTEGHSCGHVRQRLAW